MKQNVPNPVRHATAISYSVAESSHVTLEIYDVTGRKIATLVDRDQPPGLHSVQWDGRDASGNPVASGQYFYQLTEGDRAKSRKLILVR